MLLGIVPFAHRFGIDRDEVILIAGSLLKGGIQSCGLALGFIVIDMPLLGVGFTRSAHDANMNH